MSIALYSIVLAVIAILLYLALTEFRLQFARLNGRRIVTCPETALPAGVDVDSGRAALAATLTGKPVMLLKDCSRWPERGQCDQICLREIRRSPDDTLMRTTLFRWYADRSCAVCGSGFDEIDWRGCAPALLTADGRNLAWSEVGPEELRQVLATGRPMCWRCHRRASAGARIRNVLA